MRANRAADVGIVGLGAMGALAAWRLAERGARVIGIERFRPGHDRGSSHGQTRVFRTACFEDPAYVPLVQRSYGLWRRLEEASGAELMTLTGGLMIGAPEGELVTGVLRSASENHLQHQLLTQAAMKRRYPQHHLMTADIAVFEDQAGYLRPELAIQAAVARAEAFGAQIVTDTVVSAIAPDGAGLAIETTRGQFSAERVLVAAGAWTPALVPGLRLQLQVERQVLAWLAVENAGAFTEERFPIFIRELPRNRFRYGFPTADGSSIKLGVHHEGSPADPETIDREVHPADLQPIRDFARDYLNGVGSVVVRAMVCMYTNAPDDRFVVVSPPELPNLTVLSACSGHGFKFAAAIGDAVADLLLDGRPVPAIFQTEPTRAV